MNSNKLVKLLKRSSQSLLGFSNYLYIISLLKYSSIKINKTEKDIYKFIELIPDGSIILDIGSNIGVIASTLAQNKKSCTIYCYEPIPANATNIKRLIKLFKLNNIKLNQIALGNTIGTVNMLVPAHQQVLYEGHSHIANDEDVLSAGLKYSVKIDKVDNLFLNGEQQKISAIKLDVENYEFEVLQGARRVLTENKPIIFCELWNNEVRFQVIDYLKELGYSCLVNRDNKLVSTDGKTAEDLNFFFLKEA
jgi:FkbM family methyltransferase